MDIKITISDGGGTDVQYAPTVQRSQDAVAAAPPQAQAAPAPAAADSKAQFSGGLNAGAAPAELAAAGAKGAPMPFVEAVDDGAEPTGAANTDDMSAGAAPSR